MPLIEGRNERVLVANYGVYLLGLLLGMDPRDCDVLLGRLRGISIGLSGR
jgi:hypothetical protein